MKAIGMQRRILARSDDDIIRIISPISGKVITTCLPLFDMAKVQDFAYSASAKTGEIWIIKSNVNPCVVVDIWRRTNNGEDICCFCVIEGLIKDHMFDQEYFSDSFSVLASGTKNGQLLIYNLVGEVVQRQQLHFGKITCVENNPEKNLLITAGEDHVINIIHVDPNSNDFFKLKMSIQTGQIPRKLSFGKENICVAYENFSMAMFDFDIQTETWSRVDKYNKSDEHVDQITAICHVPQLDIFITASQDSTIKIWDLQSTLIRELQFHSPIKTICIANSRGDLLLDQESRIDIINHASYLPASYLKIAENTVPDSVEQLEEELVEFVEDFNHKINFSSSHIEAPESLGGIDLCSLDGLKHQEHRMHLNTINFAVSETDEIKMKTKLRLKFFERPLPCIEKTQWQQDSFYDMLPISNISLNECDPVALDARDFDATRWGADEIRIVHQVEDTLPLYILSELLPGTPDSADIESAIEAMSEISIFREASVIPLETLPKVAVEESRRESIFEQLKLAIAPDGEIPNSILSSKIQKWKDTHPDRIGHLSFAECVNLIVSKSKAIKARKKLASKQSVDEDATKKKSDFKNKIQEMLKKKQEEDQIAAKKAAEAEESTTQQLQQQERLEKNSDEITQGDSSENLKSASHSTSRGKNLHSKLVILNSHKEKVTQEEHYPKIIDQGLKNSWFPIDEVFYPQIEKIQSIYVKKDKHKEEELRKLRIEPSPENVILILLETFKKQQSASIKAEIFKYIAWIFEEFGIRDTTLLVRTFCRFLQANPYVDLEFDERKLRETIINYLPKFGLAQVELLPSLFMQLLSPVDSTKDCALNTLCGIGLFDDLFQYFIVKLKILEEATREAFFVEAAETNATRAKAKAEAKSRLLSVGNDLKVTPPGGMVRQRSISPGGFQALSVSQPGQSPALEFRNTIMSWLRKSLRKYLIRTAKDEETLQKLLESNDSGLVDRNKTNIAEKEKEDKEMCALREREMKDQIKAAAIAAAAAAASIKHQVSKNNTTKKGHSRKSFAEAKVKEVLIPGVNKGKRLSIPIHGPAAANLAAASKRPASANSIHPNSKSNK
ncbi:WD repeat-containing protein 87 [Physocladia obscura]|uniref:WD repeat-containing protein 87 n=1 Tax=Physocladia obscura TaxID=109957 RepID=A0AAD5T342_9FUNG|nr:WD repeat-containing protein 87 [Physocladia obscura]